MIVELPLEYVNFAKALLSLPAQMELFILVGG